MGLQGKGLDRLGGAVPVQGATHGHVPPPLGPEDLAYDGVDEIHDRQAAILHDSPLTNADRRPDTTADTTAPIAICLQVVRMALIFTIGE